MGKTQFSVERDKVGLPVLTEFGSDVPTKAIARMLHAEHPDLWKSIENARSWVRMRRGARGGYAGVATHPRDHGSQSDTFAKMPESLEGIEDSTPYKMGASKTLILSDVHVPYHSIESLTIALEHGINKDVDGIILNGDIIDCYALSRWVTDPRERDFVREIEATRQMLEMIREAFPDAEIVYTLGNHEERLERYLAVRAPELFGLKFLQFETFFGCDELGIPVLDRMRHIEIASLNVVHGHEFGHRIWSPVNAARGLFLRTMATSLCGHYHQKSEHVERNMNGKTIACWTTGCLCDLKPRYSPYSKKWGHGFAVVEQDDGQFEVNNRAIIDGKVR